jgi:hypothetical protein
MNPTVEGALIGALAAGGAGVVGYVANWLATRMTLKAGRSDRVWDRQALVYEEILADVVARRVRRDHVARSNEIRLCHRGGNQRKDNAVRAFAVVCI